MRFCASFSVYPILLSFRNLAATAECYRIPGNIRFAM